MEEGEFDMEEGEDESDDIDQKLVDEMDSASDQLEDEPLLRDEMDMEEGEDDGDDQYASDDGLEEESKGEDQDGEGDEVDIDTNIESKRDKAISDLLKKEDLGLI